MTQENQPLKQKLRAKIVFMGSPEFAIPTLDNLHREHDVVAVYTQPPRKSGRGLHLHQTPIADYAKQLNLKCFTPETLATDETLKKLKRLRADFFVVVGYGLLLPQSILDLPRLGCINGHASLLPRWRGAAPIQRAIAADDRRTGITAMLMDAGLDTGQIIVQIPYPIKYQQNAAKLHDKLAAICGGLLKEVIDAMLLGKMKPTPQPEAGMTYAAKITAKDSCLDITQSAHKLALYFRAFSPKPGVWIPTISGRIKLIAAQAVDNHKFKDAPPGIFLGRSAEHGLCLSCGNDSFLEISRLQPAGKSEMSADDFLNGYRWQEGAQIQAEDG